MKKIVKVSIVMFLLSFSLYSSAATIDEIRESLIRIRAQLASLNLNQSSVTSTNSFSTCPNLTRPIGRGDNDASTLGQVSTLQKYLRDKGFYTYPDITGFYGVVTEESVKRFQASVGIIDYGDANSTGYGFVGQRTASFIRTSCGTNSNSPTNTNQNNNSQTSPLQVTLKTNKTTYTAGETVIVTGTITNNTSEVIEGSVVNCTGMSLDIDRKINAYLQGPTPCFEYEKTAKVKPGEKQTYIIKIIATNNKIENGKYVLTSVFPGNIKETTSFKVTGGPDSVTFGDHVETKVTLNKETFKPGETIIVYGTIENNTSNSIVDNLGACEKIKLEVSGLTDVGVCSNYFSYLDEIIYAEQTRNYTAYFTLGDDVVNGKYVMKVTFPGKFTEKVDFEVKK